MKNASQQAAPVIGAFRQQNVRFGSFASILAGPGYVGSRGNPGSTGPTVLSVEGIGLDKIK
jgi:hypothetical protein